ncbi:enoyl-CoA hydratase [Lentzea sp. BCCO 10_0061]|uniref:Enoyl-CoA hydratase n=1 Tax=Lentzea sokolovensis TaxID=3095429 RepID=A0ABU4UZL2_9PSEU|nr:enoyl-CoA hydratase [Lentzea sp. BCCO 10_0061]MDX8144675.1 enoyl-CoA hydratase [Lentzea sp. BCCO 10_0061]
MAEVLLEYDESVAVITINDPERRNALTIDLSQELADKVEEAEQNANALIVTGAPPAFCAGADLTQLGNSKDEGLKKIYKGFLAVANAAIPTIAAVNGAAVGAGLNLALAADVRIAGPKARFDARFLQLGIHPGGGMTWMLQRITNRQTATAMTLFGQILDADQAVAHGLAYARAEDPLAVAKELARVSAEAPAELVRTIKATMRVTDVLDDHAEAVEIELTPQVTSIDTPEFAARLAAMKARISGR